MLALITSNHLPFQLNYKFSCYHCLNAADGSEKYELTKCSWLESIIGGFSSLIYNTQRDMFKVSAVHAANMGCRPNGWP